VTIRWGSLKRQSTNQTVPAGREGERRGSVYGTETGQGKAHVLISIGRDKQHFKMRTLIAMGRSLNLAVASGGGRERRVDTQEMGRKVFVGAWGE